MERSEEILVAFVELEPIGTLVGCLVNSSQHRHVRDNEPTIVLLSLEVRLEWNMWVKQLKWFSWTYVSCHSTL